MAVRGFAVAFPSCRPGQSPAARSLRRSSPAISLAPNLPSASRLLCPLSATDPPPHPPHPPRTAARPSVRSVPPRRHCHLLRYHAHYRSLRPRQHLHVPESIPDSTPSRTASPACLRVRIDRHLASTAAVRFDPTASPFGLLPLSARPCAFRSRPTTPPRRRYRSTPVPV